GGFSVADTPEQVVSLLEELMDLHNRRVGAVSAVLAPAAHRRFHALAPPPPVPPAGRPAHGRGRDGPDLPAGRRGGERGAAVRLRARGPRLLLPERHRALRRPQPWAGGPRRRHRLGVRPRT